MNGRDLKEKLIIFSVTAGVFLPVRLLFTLHVGEHWLGSLGLVSAFALLFMALIKRNKLGWFGIIFEKQIRKTIRGRTGKYITGFAILFLVYFGASLFFIDRGSTTYSDDKEIFFLAITETGKFNIEDIPLEKLSGPEPLAYASLENYLGLSNLEYALSIAFAIMDDMSGGWLTHLVVVIFIEQLEIVGLLYLYRRTYKPELTV